MDKIQPEERKLGAYFVRIPKPSYLRTERDVCLPPWMILIEWVGALSLVLFGWFYLWHIFADASVSSLDGLGVFLLAVCQASVWECLFAATSFLPWGWHYRWAFFCSLGSLGLAGGLIYLLAALPDANIFPVWMGLPVFLAAAGGAFTGSLWATHRREGLWEDNSTPSEDVQFEVLALHQCWFDRPAAIPWAKRLFDILLAVVGLALSSPIWLTVAFLIWFDDPGPLLFVKNSVGRGGRNFRQFKFRTMVHGAEEGTGPVLSQQGDPRVLRVGRLLRKSAQDELPQLLNILRGEMSFVGPRPQRTVLVRDYLEHIPAYAERHRVQPGLAGLAQVAGSYYITPLQKLRFDRIYIQHSGLGFDLKLIILAFLLAFWFRWQKGWRGRLPRQLLHGG